MALNSVELGKIAKEACMKGHQAKVSKVLNTVPSS